MNEHDARTILNRVHVAAEALGTLDAVRLSPMSPDNLHVAVKTARDLARQECRAAYADALAVMMNAYVVDGGGA